MRNAGSRSLCLTPFVVLLSAVTDILIALLDPRIKLAG
jgi:ABC-type dipeptide/oligopeptide/nickel transport system permease component